MPFGLQPIHILIIILVAVLLFGATKLPEIGRGLGRSINEFKKGIKEIPGEFNQGMNDAPSSAETFQPSSIPQPDNNFCPHCGSRNVADAKFCNKCGSPLPVSQS
jgi:sec-independent protein translocase protein TatA